MRLERSLPTVCILAGGRGTRLGNITAKIPKALVEVAGEPFIFHQLRLLAEHGTESVVLCVGYLGEQIRQAVGSMFEGLSVTYSFDSPGLDGTLGAILRARHLLGDRFLVLYGDTYLRLDYRAAVRTWEASGAPAMMTVLRNKNEWGPSNVCYAEGRVLVYDKRHPSPDMEWVDYGLGGLSASILDEGTERGDLADLYTRLAASGSLCGVEVTERFFEVGSPEALSETDAFLRRIASSRRGSGD